MNRRCRSDRRRSSTVLAVLALLLGAAVSACGNGPSDDDAAKVANEYLSAISSGDADDLAHLPKIFPDDTPIDLDRAARLLTADTTTRIDHVIVGDPKESKTVSDTTGRSGTGLAFRKFETFPVTFSLDDHTVHNQVVVGLTTDDPRWLVVTPLDVATPWSRVEVSGPGGARVAPESAHVRIGDVDLGSLADLTQNDSLLHPGLYEASVEAGRYLAAKPVDLAASSAEDPAPADVTISLSPAGVARLKKNAIAAFSRCDDGTAFCPVRDLVIPHLPEPPATKPSGWWKGLTKEPRMRVVGDTLRLRGGEFRYDTGHGIRTVRFEGTAPIVFGDDVKTATGAIGPGHEEPNVGAFFHVLRTR